MNSTPDKPSGPASASTTAAPSEDLIGEELIAYEVDGDAVSFFLSGQQLRALSQSRMNA